MSLHGEHRLLPVPGTEWREDRWSPGDIACWRHYRTYPILSPRTIFSSSSAEGAARTRAYSSATKTTPDKPHPTFCTAIFSTNCAILRSKYRTKRGVKTSNTLHSRHSRRDQKARRMAAESLLPLFHDSQTKPMVDGEADDLLAELLGEAGVSPSLSLLLNPTSLSSPRRRTCWRLSWSPRLHIRASCPLLSPALPNPRFHWSYPPLAPLPPKTAASVRETASTGQAPHSATPLGVPWGIPLTAQMM